MKHVRDDPTNCVLLFEDEGTFYRQPSQAWLWARRGRSQPRMRYSHRANTRMRVVAYLNAASGGVHSEEMSSVTVQRLAGSLAQLSRWYPDAKTIYLVWDNWPNHTHPKVTRALSSQARVRVLPLPTYAPTGESCTSLVRRLLGVPPASALRTRTTLGRLRGIPALHRTVHIHC